MVIISLAVDKVSPDAYKWVSSYEQILFMSTDFNDVALIPSIYARYPACVKWEPTSSKVYVVVNASLSRNYPEKRAAMLNIVFGAAGWLAMVVHILLIEIYL